RCIWPDSSREIPFVEVLVADGLTSLAKVFFDITMGTCVAMTASGYSWTASESAPLWLGEAEPFHLQHGNFSLTEAAPSATAALLLGTNPLRPGLGEALDQCGQSPLPFLAWFVPFMIRARQCMISAKHAPDSTSQALQKVNVLKYMSAAPVVFFAMCHGKALPGLSTFTLLGPDDFEAMWAISAVVNSFFSFSWDLVMDWGLLNPSTPLRSHQFGLRPVLLYGGLTGFYHFAILFNFIGRTLWTLRWSPQATVFLGTFFLASLQQAAEVARRCLWSVIRVEWECVKKGVRCDDKKIFP
ncbi:unnamed protein product, partial [Polarella glacialis]